MIDALCQRWHCPPSVLLQEDAGLVLGILGVLAAAEGVPEPQDAPPHGDRPQRADSGHPGASGGDMERLLAAQSKVNIA